MPVYVYEPVNNEQEIATERECCHFEKLQSLSEAACTVCPVCGGEVQRAITSFAVFRAMGSSRSSLQAIASPVSSQKEISSLHSESPSARIAKMVSSHACGAGCRH